jgi:5-methylthioadenosine/S-adenosylhomocysteine deaminase
MRQSIVRSRAMIPRTLSRMAWEEIADGAILQRDGIIEAVGTLPS